MGWPILLNVVLDVTLPQDYDHVVVSIAGWTPPKGTWLKDAIELIEEEDDVAVVTLGVPDEWQTKRGVMPVESRGYWIVPRVWDGFVARREHLEMWRAVPYLPVYGDVFGDFSEYNHGHGVVLRPGNWDNPPLDLKFPESATTMSLDGGLFRD